MNRAQRRNATAAKFVSRARRWFRKFRRREHLLVTLGRTDEAPRRTWEITPSWNLGCEGHQWCGDASPELQARVMRK